jgi:hypothetical protein
MLVLLIGGGVTLASFALPVVFGVRAASLSDDAEALGAGHSGYAQRHDDFTTARTTYWVSFAVPAVLAAATATVAVR